MINPLPSYGLIPAISLELLFRLAGIHVFLILDFQDQKNIFTYFLHSFYVPMTTNPLKNHKLILIEYRTGGALIKF